MVQPKEPQELLDTLATARAQAEEDLLALAGLPPKARIADYGCGTGLRTIALMELLSPSQAIGIDKDPAAIKQASFHASQIASAHVTVQQTLPVFIVGDVVTAENIPSDLQCAFSRRLLLNLMHIAGHADAAQVATALRNIALSLAPDGWAMFVEEAAQHTDFSPAFETADLRLISRDPFRYRDSVLPMVRYVCRKDLLNSRADG